MVAVIKTGNSIRRAFSYNELKVKEGVAECIGAENYPKDPEKMTEHQRLTFLIRQAELNENVRRNSVHISLNFAPGEVLSYDQLREISREYMNGIGFGNQPYLVYQHHDAGHPHIHIVTTKISADGSRIDTQNIGRNQSETARKAIEKKYGLVRAEDHKRQHFELKPVSAQRVSYGKTATKRAIQNVLETVLKEYKYTSLPELNAVLNLYNVRADRGSEDSRIYKNNGLVYRALDTNGSPVGVPIKASDFYNKPTLKHLENRFEKHQTERQKHKTRLKNTIDLALKGRDLSLENLSGELKNEGIAMVFRQNDEGRIYGITYVDHRTKCVFNGSALGKNFSAKAIQERCGLDTVQELPQLKNAPIQKQISSLEPREKHRKTSQISVDTPENKPGLPGGMNPLEELLKVEETHEYLPFEWRKRRKKRKKKGLSR